MVRYYALLVLAGIVVAALITERRWRARGGEPGVVWDVLIWAVPFGILGARLYHLVTSPGAYFGPGGDPVSALYIWRGGLSVWGGIAGGSLAAVLLLRRRGIAVAPFAGAAAPAIPVGQAIGRWGCYFNQELFGAPTTLPWGLSVDPAYRPSATAALATYHPTFLYESLWALAVALLVWWLERRLHLDGARTFAVYVAGYALGRIWIETLRVDPATMLFGVRLNVYTAVVVLTAAVACLIRRAVRTDPPTVSADPNRGNIPAAGMSSSIESSPGRTWENTKGSRT